MKTRLLGAITAVLLAAIGTVLLVNYVGNAEARALEGAETVQVLVAAEAIAAGTPAEELADSVVKEAIPAKVVPSDAVKSLGQLSGQVTTVGLVLGEQLLSTRFENPNAIAESEEVEVPDGMQEVTIALEAQRVVGGQLETGSTAGVVISMDKDSSAKEVSHLALHKVLVTAVQGLPASPETAEEAEAPDATSSAVVPEGSVLVTLALKSSDVEKVIFGQEFGSIWLTNEPMTASEDGTRQVTVEGIYE